MKSLGICYPPTITESVGLLGLLLQCENTAVGSGFGPQGVPDEKPRNLLPTHHHRECGFAGTVAAV